MGMLDGKVGLVTGAAQGLGRATALLAAHEGSAVLVSDVQEAAGEAVAKDIRAAGGRARVGRAGVTLPAQLGARVARGGRAGDALPRAAACEYAARGLRVNSVAPGGFETPALQRYFERFPEKKQQTIATNAQRRLGKPEEVAEPVIWLASDRSAFVPGASVACD